MPVVKLCTELPGCMLQGRQKCSKEIAVDREAEGVTEASASEQASKNTDF